MEALQRFGTENSFSELPEFIEKLKADLALVEGLIEDMKRLETDEGLIRVGEHMREIEALEYEKKEYEEVETLLFRYNEKMQRLDQDLEGAFQLYQDLVKNTSLDLVKSFQTAILVYRTVTSIQDLAEVLISPIESRLQYHFRSDAQTNRLDKPEWCLKWVLSVLTFTWELLNGLLRPLDPISSIRSLLFERVLGKIEEKAKADMGEILKCEPGTVNTLLVHYIDESMKYDYQLREQFPWLDFSLILCLTKDRNVFDTWREIDVKFALTQFNKEFEQEDDPETTPWNRDKIEGFVFLHLRHVTSLLEAFNSRYSLLSTEELKTDLLLTVERKIIPQYFDKCSQFFQTLKRSVLAYESNPSFWTDVFTRLCALYHTITHFQEFLYSMQRTVDFEQEILASNATKSAIVESLLHLLMYSLLPHLKTYNVTGLVHTSEASGTYVNILQCIGAMQSTVLKAAPEPFAKYILNQFSEELLASFESDLRKRQKKLTSENLKQFQYETSLLRNLIAVEPESFKK